MSYKNLTCLIWLKKTRSPTKHQRLKSYFYPMHSQRKLYLLFLTGFLGAVAFLWLKITLYDKLEYESDLFGILQLSRDFWWGKPFMYENGYGNDLAFHNYFLTPFLAPATLVFGGKGLFVAGFACMVWALALAAKLLARVPLWKGAVFLVFLFSPTGFFVWDNYHFGWHPENLFFPLSVAFVAALALRDRTSVWVSAIFMVLSREDGILLVWSLYVLYTAATTRTYPTVMLKKLVTPSVATALVFLAGMAMLHYFSGGESRMGITAERFMQNYTPSHLRYYVEKSLWNWLLICGVVWLPALAAMHRLSFIFWGLVGLLPLLAAAFYSGGYYFPDLKYGINWAPRMAGIYGYVLCTLMLALVYGRQKYNVSAYGALAIPLTLAVCYLQYAHLKSLPYYYRYSVLDRVHLALFRGPATEKDPHTLAELQALSERLPHNFAVRMDGHLFALFDHTDLIWPARGHKPYHAPELVITSGRTPNEEPIPQGFIPMRRIGPYEIWGNPENRKLKDYLLPNCR